MSSIAARETSREPHSENWSKARAPVTLEMLDDPQETFAEDIGWFIPVVMILVQRSRRGRQLYGDVELFWIQDFAPFRQVRWYKRLQPVMFASTLFPSCSGKHAVKLVGLARQE